MALFFKSKKKKGKNITDDQEIQLKEDTAFSVQEAYKALRTNIIFSMTGNKSRCIGVSSSTQAEGKSTNAINLAASFAQIGKKVLLIDCDLRLPTIALKLDMPGQPGLSDYLVGECTLEKAVKKSEDMNFDVLPAGNIPPEATGLLQSEEMKNLLDQLKEEYDYVFVDLPPINVVTDAIVLAGCIDGFLLVVKHESSEYRMVASMVDQLRFVHAKILGFIYTNTPVNNKKYYYKGYYGNGHKDRGGI